jgi:hypothetical protein
VAQQGWIVADSPSSRYRWYHVGSGVPQFIVGLLTLGAVGLYTWNSAQQVSESETANKLAKQALGEANKPYVMFSKLVPRLTKDVNGLHKQAGLTFTNYGNTPALDPLFYICKLIIQESREALTYKCDLLESPSKTNAIGPKQSTTFAGPVISDSDLEASKDEHKFIYLFGYLKYNDKIDVDSYGNVKRRVTSFCTRIIQPTIISANSTTKQIPGLASSQIAPPSNPSQLGNEPQPNATNVIELPFTGYGCPNFDYCIDDDCPDLPKQ